MTDGREFLYVARDRSEWEMVYIATFYSHFGAIRFKKICEGAGMKARMMPVPRDLSSSCGTCVRYEGEEPCPGGAYSEEIEQVVERTDSGYKLIYSSEE